MKPAPPTLDEAARPLRSPITGLFCSELEYEDDYEHIMGQRRSDIEHVQKIIRGLREPEPCGEGFGPCDERWAEVPGSAQEGCTYPDCDCFVSETVMLSTGYAEVYSDWPAAPFGYGQLDAQYAAEACVGGG